jgi:hypothetical protein
VRERCGDGADGPNSSGIADPGNPRSIIVDIKQVVVAPHDGAMGSDGSSRSVVGVRGHEYTDEQVPVFIRLGQLLVIDQPDDELLDITIIERVRRIAVCYEYRPPDPALGRTAILSKPAQVGAMSDDCVDAVLDIRGRDGWRATPLDTPEHELHVHVTDDRTTGVYERRTWRRVTIRIQVGAHLANDFASDSGWLS